MTSRANGKLIPALLNGFRSTSPKSRFGKQTKALIAMCNQGIFRIAIQPSKTGRAVGQSFHELAEDCRDTVIRWLELSGSFLMADSLSTSDNWRQDASTPTRTQVHALGMQTATRWFLKDPVNDGKATGQ